MKYTINQNRILQGTSEKSGVLSCFYPAIKIFEHYSYYDLENSKKSGSEIGIWKVKELK